MKPYPKYHPVNFDYINQLPEGWQLLPNIAVFEERNEKGFINEELLSVTIGKGVLKQSEIDKKDSSNPDKSNYKLVEIGDFVYSMRFRQGASGYSNYKGIVSSACTVLKPKIEINPKFYHYHFRLGFYRDYAKRYCYGIADGQFPLRFNDFKRMYSIVPPLETQNRIVAFLEEKEKMINEFVRRKERLVELLEITKKDAINKILENTKHEKKKLKYVCRFVYGNSLASTSRNKGTIPVYGSNGIIDYHNQTITDEPCIIIGRKGSFGKVNYSKEKCFPIDTTYFVDKTTTKENLEWLFHALQTIGLDDISYDTGIPGLNREVAYNKYMKVPPLEEQQQIVSKINAEKTKTEKIIAQIQKEIAAINQYKESLIHSLVLGKVECKN